MLFVRTAACVIVAALAAMPVLAATDTSGALAGLWQAKKRFGPDVRGTLTIVHDGAGWRADIAGRHAGAVAEGDMVTFALPRGEGRFRGRLIDGGKVLRGHWVQQKSIAGGMAYAAPVELAYDGHGVWRGQVNPLDDAFTLYLKISANPDGSTGVFLRNPDRNIGNYVNLQHIQREGDRVTLLGKPGGADKEVPITNGSFDADSDVLSITVPGRGGTYDFERADKDSDFYPRAGQTGPYVYRPPLPRDDGWPVATLAAVDIAQPAIERFVQILIDQPIDSVHAQEIHGVLVARHGKLVLEEYFHGIDGNRPHDMRSAAKSMTSVLIGAAIQDGAPIGPETPVFATMGGPAPAHPDPRKNALRLEHLLTMSSGLYCDDRDSNAPGNEDVMQNQSAQPDWYRYALDLPMASAPGETAVYCSTNPNLAGGLLAKVTGERLEDSFDRLLARPLQFGRYALDLQPTGQPYMGGGAQFLPRDFMKLGQLMLDHGVWHGKRVVSEDWVKRSTAPIRSLRGLHYGYFWWGIDLPYRGSMLPAFYAAGNGGQVVMVVPALDLVVAIYGGNYGDKVMYAPQEVYTPKYILPAVN